MENMSISGCWSLSCCRCFTCRLRCKEPLELLQLAPEVVVRTSGRTTLLHIRESGGKYRRTRTSCSDEIELGGAHTAASDAAAAAAAAPSSCYFTSTAVCPSFDCCRGCYDVSLCSLGRPHSATIREVIARAAVVVQPHQVRQHGRHASALPLRTVHEHTTRIRGVRRDAQWWRRRRWRQQRVFLVHSFAHLISSAHDALFLLVACLCCHNSIAAFNYTAISTRACRLPQRWPSKRQ